MTECEKIAVELGILNDLENDKVGKGQFKMIVRNAIDKKNDEMLRAEISTYSKLKEWEGDEYSKKEYLKDLSLQEARLKFSTL